MPVVVAGVVRAGDPFGGCAPLAAGVAVGVRAVEDEGRVKFAMDWEPIWNRARADLALGSDRAERHASVFEHCARVAETARRLAVIPAVQATAPDTAALVAAALYHEAGWVVALREARVRPEEILLRPLSDSDREDGARMLTRSLRTLLPADSLGRASLALRSLGDRNADSVEGRILSDSDNLQEFGLLSLWTTVRRGTIEGRGVKSILETWRRRKEYHFWDARLRDGFYFAEVRALAERRLATLEAFMSGLEAEEAGCDVDALLEEIGCR